MSPSPWVSSQLPVVLPSQEWEWITEDCYRCSGHGPNTLRRIPQEQLPAFPDGPGPPPAQGISLLAQLLLWMPSPVGAAPLLVSATWSTSPPPPLIHSEHIWKETWNLFQQVSKTTQTGNKKRPQWTGPTGAPSVKTKSLLLIVSR